MKTHTSRKKMISVVLCIALGLTFISGGIAFAQETGTGEPGQAACLEGCTLETGHEGECVLAPAGTEDGPADGKPTAAEQLQAKIDALPAPEETVGMDDASLEALKAEMDAIYAGIDALADGAQALDAEKLDALAQAFAPAPMMAAALAADDEQGGIEVNIDGTKTYFGSIQEAIDSVADGQTAVITVPAGTYGESIKIDNGPAGKHISRNITLQGAQAGTSGIGRGDGGESVITGGIEIQGLHNSESVMIDGFTLHKKGINVLGWGNPFHTEGTLSIQNNIITDVADGTISAIHMNMAANEKIGTIEIARNYIHKIGEAGNATNGIYIVCTTDQLDIIENVVSNVNHSCVQLASAIVGQLNMEGNTLTNWNQDGDGGSGAGGSNGDGIYLPKTSQTTSVTISENKVMRDEDLPGRSGYAARIPSLAGNQEQYDLSNNYWGTKPPEEVISGFQYAVVSPYYTDEQMQDSASRYIGKISFYCPDMQLNGTAERKLSPSLTVFGKQQEQAIDYKWQTSDDGVVALEQRPDAVYAVAKGLGTAVITLSAEDPVSGETISCNVEVAVGNNLEEIRLEDKTMLTGSTEQMELLLLPEGSAIPSYYTYEWSSDNETVASVDENGLVTAGNTAGTAMVTVECKSFGTVKYTASAKITVVDSIPITAVTVDKTATLRVEEEKTLTAVIEPENTTEDKTLSWSTSAPEIVTVDAAGKLTGIREGTAIVRVSTKNGLSAECTVHVLAELRPEIKEVYYQCPATGITLHADTTAAPEGAYLSVKPIPETEQDYADAKELLKDKAGKFVLYDITLVNAQGEAIQPAGPVVIGIPVPDGYDRTALAVHRIGDDKTTSEYGVTESEGMAYIQTEHFSKYALAEKGSMSGTGAGADGGTSPDTPKTGDTADLAPYLLLVIAAAAAITLAVRNKKQHQEK